MDEEEGYSPPSAFLCSIVAEEVAFGADPYGRANLALLLALTRDADQANRDWATMLLVHTGQDDEAIRAALRERLDDPFEDARLEALIGVAQREPEVALPIVAALLGEDMVFTGVLEAAAYVADARLLPVLRDFPARWRSDPFWVAAVTACESGTPPDWRSER